MPFAGHQTAIITFTSTIQGEQCVNSLEYGIANTGDWSTPAKIADEVVSTVVPEWLAAMSEAATLETVYVETTSPTGTPPYPPAIRFIGSVGDIVSECMPPNVTARLYKTPDNTSIEGTLTDPFRVGMLRFSGVPENAQTSGVLDSTYLALLTALGNVLVALPPITGENSGTLLFNLLMVRRESSPPAFGLTSVIDVTPSTILGTQNTRKIGR